MQSSGGGALLLRGALVRVGAPSFGAETHTPLDALPGGAGAIVVAVAALTFLVRIAARTERGERARGAGQRDEATVAKLAVVLRVAGSQT